jgi:hypothetical protein
MAEATTEAARTAARTPSGSLRWPLAGWPGLARQGRGYGDGLRPADREQVVGHSGERLCLQAVEVEHQLIKAQTGHLQLDLGRVASSECAASYPVSSVCCPAQRVSQLIQIERLSEDWDGVPAQERLMPVQDRRRGRADEDGDLPQGGVPHHLLQQGQAVLPARDHEIDDDQIRLALPDQSRHIVPLQGG